MKEDVDYSKKEYESCYHFPICEAWIIPKMSIYDLESKIYMFIRYRSEVTPIYLEGERTETFDFDIERFMKYIDGKKMEEMSMEELKQNSVIYDTEMSLFLYNQDDFSIQNNKLFVNSKYLSPIYHGNEYRFNNSFFYPPSYKGNPNNRAYLLNECGEVIHIAKYDFFRLKIKE